MSLQQYRAKRNFKVTPEPKPSRSKGSGDSFVVQKHAARRLHYDFRLEMDGALKSWAVTKGPSLIPTEKRLAVHVEDHPLEYGAFEGTIPKDQYGGGEVLLWDRGHWRPAEDPHKGYAKGHLKFYLEGEKLKGLWHLVRLKKRDGDRQEPWLLIKSDDDAARRPGDPDILEEMPLSVTTNRSIEDIANGIGPKRVWNSKPRNDIPKQRIALDPPAPKPLLKRGRAKLPDFTPPCLATLRDSPPLGGDWIHEIKFDGYRTQARMQKSAVQILTRSGLDWTHRFKPIANALAQWSLDRALLDGEIVLEDENGVSNFSALQAALKSGQSDRFVYYVFDLLHLDGNDLSRKPLIERKALLEKLIAAQSPTPRVRYSEHFEEDATAFFKHACKMSLEGIISKRTGAPYRSGRNADWLKIKCTTRQEFVIIGYNSSGVAGRPLRSLAIGYYEGGALRYAGNVGTGYSEAALRDLGKLLLPLRIDKSLIKKSELPPEAKGTHWVRPQLVAEIEFSGFTGGNVARHAAFKGLRDDKRAEGVVREMAAPKPIVEPRKASRSASNGDVVAGVRLTHPDRLYWPDPGIDKRELARFYEGIWDWIAPHVVERPLSLLRCPDGLDSCFFQKHIAAGLDQKVIGAVRDPGEKDLLMIDDLPGLIALVQAGVLEIHVWGAKAKDIESCDRIVFDLDPGDEVSWREVIDAAREIRERLNALKLESFVKTSGGKGLHVVLPITGADWTRAKDFAHAIALSMAADAPNRYTTNMAKRARLGRIFIDYLRNGRGATSICAYSTRARPGAAVSVPIEWPELMAKMSPDKFNVRNLQRRLKTRKQDPWEAMAKLRQRLSK